MSPRPSFSKPAHVPNNQNTVYISNLSYMRDRDGLKKLFIPYGDVVSVKVVMDRKTNKPTGMAFVEMKNYFQANKAIQELNGQNVDGRTVKASPAIAQRKPAHVSKPMQESGMPQFAKPNKEVRAAAKPSKDSRASKEAKSSRRKEGMTSSLDAFLSNKKQVVSPLPKRAHRLK